MQFYRLIKPLWAQPMIGSGKNKKPNPDFIEAIEGPNTIEDCNLTDEFIKEKNAAGYNVYWFPNHPSESPYQTDVKYLSGKYIDVFDYVFVDMDLKDGVYKTKEDFYNKLREFPVKPTLTLDSGNGVHAYWKMEDLTRDTFVITQLALLKYFNTDDSVWTVLQLMRYPGSKNTKRHKDYVQTTTVADITTGACYKMSDLPKEIYTAVDEESARKAKVHLDRLDGKISTELTEEVDLDSLPKSFVSLMESNKTARDLFNDPKGSYGDRSGADMKLANLLYSKNFSKQDALVVLSNTQKALEKGPHRKEYAFNTIDKVYTDRSKNQFKTVSQIISSSSSQILPPRVLGPDYLDTRVLGKPWRKKELLGLIAGSGVGKTAKALNMIKCIIENNADQNQVFIFYSLEMPAMSVIERWIQLVGDKSPLTDKLYVIDNYDENGLPRNIGLQEIYNFSMDIKKSTGADLGAIVIDHIHLISPMIDPNKQPNFGTFAEYGGYGEKQKLGLGAICSNLKSLVNSLDTFGIILTQTTKEKGVGDTPIGKDGAYGISQYEWIMDRILTIWQPLMRVQKLTDLRFLAFQYVKIREKHKDDKIFENDPKLLLYDLGTGNLSIPDQDQYQVFRELLPQANEARQALQKKESNAYSVQLDLNEVDQLIKNNLQVVK